MITNPAPPSPDYLPTLLPSEKGDKAEGGKNKYSARCESRAMHTHTLTHTNTHTHTQIPSMAPARFQCATLCKVDVKVSYQLSRFAADTHNMWQEGSVAPEWIPAAPGYGAPQCAWHSQAKQTAGMPGEREPERERERHRKRAHDGECSPVGVVVCSVGLGASCNYVGVA